MGSLAEVRLGDIGSALGRYRPVAITVGLILVVLVALPDAEKAPAGALAPTSVAPAGAPAASADPTAASASPTAATAPSAFDSGSSSSSGSSFSSGSSSFASDSSSSLDPSSSDTSSDAGNGPAAPTDFDTPSSDFPSPTTSEPDPDPARPLFIVGSGWASATGATPLGSTGVPAGVLPVGKRIGQTDKFSFVRLNGDAPVLILTEVADGARTTAGVVGVSACQITDDTWAEQDNVPSDRAPKFDSTKCSVGSRATDGSWSFDLTPFPTPTDRRGFALVPTGASIDYQVNFRRP